MKTVISNLKKASVLAVAILVLTVSTNVVVSPQSVGASSACVSNVYYYGRSGACVSYLQHMLNGIGRFYNYKGYDSLSTDGQFGSRTRGQVYNYQWFANLKGDGIVGPMTWHSLCYDAYNRVGGEAADYGRRAGC